jgi:glycosyltransferase involved in cell wall biosynthesis
VKIGLYTRYQPPSLGGGYVLRDDVEKAALSFRGRHEFQLVPVGPLIRGMSRVKRRINRALGRPTEEKLPISVVLREEVERQKLDLLWFNHFEPVHVGTPYILNIFDLQHRLQPWFPEVSANGQWEIREAQLADSIRRAAIVTVGSHEAKEQLCHFYGVPLDNVKVLPFPTPQKAIELATGKAQMPQIQDVRSKYGIKNKFLYYPAQFWPHKNHVNLVRALKVLKDRGHNVSLVLTGSDHGNQPHVEKAARDLGLADHVHFCGFVPYEDVLAFYKEALALAYVSFFGPENLPPLEAMALGCPVILSNIPGVQALHGDGPVLVDPRQPESIAQGIESLLLDPAQIAARVEMGRRVAIQNSCQRYLEGLQDVLDEFEPFRRCWP